MTALSEYGQWLWQRVNSGLRHQNLQLHSPGGRKWSYTVSAIVLSAMLVMLSMVQWGRGGNVDHRRRLKEESDGVTSSGSARSMPHMSQQESRLLRPDPESEGWVNTVAICATMTDTHADDLREWLQYHRWLGVDKIFLRELQSADFTQESPPIKEMTDIGFLNFGPWEGDSPAATQLWLNRCSATDLAGGYSWVLFSDLDHYMVLLNEQVAVKQPDLKGFLEKRKGLAGLSIHRVLFGSNGYEKRPSPGGPLSHYTKCKDLFSFPAKCLASSFHMCSTPFVDPSNAGLCAYRKMASRKENYGLKVEYGDGLAGWDLKLSPVDTTTARNAASTWLPEQQGQEKEKCVAYERKMHDAAWGHSPRDVSKDEALVLFHYVTRSYEEFVASREPKLPGVYASFFRERWEAAQAARDDAENVVDDVDVHQDSESEPPQTEMQIAARRDFDEFESTHLFNLEAPVCSSVVDAEYVKQCCTAAESTNDV